MTREWERMFVSERGKRNLHGVGRFEDHVLPVQILLIDNECPLQDRALIQGANKDSSSIWNVLP